MGKIAIFALIVPVEFLINLFTILSKLAVTFPCIHTIATGGEFQGSHPLTKCAIGLAAENAQLYDHLRLDQASQKKSEWNMRYPRRSPY
jgi:hypothetical protein